MAMTTSGPPPPGVSMLSQRSQRQRVPPPPGEDSREVWQSDDMGIGPKIPQALEKILQLKEIRQEQRIAAPTGEDDDDTADTDMNSSRPYSDDEEENALSKKDKRRKRRNRKKKKRNQEKSEQVEGRKSETEKDKEKEPEVEIEYVTEEPEIYDPNYIFFKRIFEAFKLTDDVKKEKEKEPEKTEKPEITSYKKKFLEEKKDSDDSDEEMKPDVPKLSKKKLRRMNRLTVAELKQLVARPDVVEMHDVTAYEPKLLVHLKATRNIVPVPRHWCFKRKYLRGRGVLRNHPSSCPSSSNAPASRR